MKHILYILCVLVIGATFLVGCANQSEAEETAQILEGSDLSQNTDANKQKVLDALTQGETVSECSYDFIHTDGGNKQTSRCYYLNSAIRAESDNRVYLIDKDGVTEYSPSDKTGSHMTYDEYDKGDDQSPVDWVRRCLGSPEFAYIREETLDGVECMVIKVEDPSGIYTAWVQQETGLMVKIDAGQDVIEYKNLKAGPGTVDASLLEIPKDIVINSLTE